MNEAESMLIAEIKKRLGSSIMEAVDYLAFAFIEPRVPDEPNDRVTETLINIYGIRTALDRGSESRPPKGKAAKARNRTDLPDACPLCGGSEHITMGDSIRRRIYELKQDLGTEPWTDEWAITHDIIPIDDKATREGYQADIDYLEDALNRMEDKGDSDKMISCPRCSGWKWVDVKEYQDPVTGKFNKKKADKYQSPWNKVVKWVWDTLGNTKFFDERLGEEKSLNPTQYGKDPKAAGFESHEDKFGADTAGDKSEHDVWRHIIISIDSIGLTNQEVHENFKKIVNKNKGSLSYFKINAWPSGDLERQYDIEMSQNQNMSTHEGDAYRRTLAWIEENRGFYVSGKIDEPRYGEDIGLPKFEVREPYDISKLLEKLRGKSEEFNDYVTLKDTIKVPLSRWGVDPSTIKVMNKNGEIAQIDVDYKIENKGGRWGVSYIQRLPTAQKIANDEAVDIKFQRISVPPDMPPARVGEWGKLIKHIKSTSASKRSERSKIAHQTYIASPEYLKSQEDAETAQKHAEAAAAIIRKWPGSKYKYWDNKIKKMSEALGQDAAAVEASINKYFDSLKKFPSPFDFDRLSEGDAAKALNILYTVEPSDIIKLSEEVYRYIDNIMTEDNDRVVDVAATVIADMGSDQANILYNALKTIKEEILSFADNPLRSSDHTYNKDLITAEGMLKSLIKCATPNSKIVRVAPIPNYTRLFDESTWECWNNIVNGSVPDDTNPMCRNIAVIIHEGMMKRANELVPWIISPIKKMVNVSVQRESDEIAKAIGMVWNSAVCSRPIIIEQYESIAHTVEECGASEILNGGL